MPVVLDSLAIMRLLDDDEPAASRVQQCIDSGEAVLSWINLAEVLYLLRRRHGADAATRAVRDLEGVLRAVLPDRATFHEAAAIKADYSMSYADSFAAATALKYNAELWTGDPELLVANAPWRTRNPMV